MPNKKINELIFQPCLHRIVREAVIKQENNAQYVYFDTCILSQIAKNKDLWEKLRTFLFYNKFTLAISGVHLTELSEATNLHSSLSTLLVKIPSGLIKEFDVILNEEVNRYPVERSETLLSFLFHKALPEHLENIALKSKEVIDARTDQLQKSYQFVERHFELKRNFPPSDDSGNYISSQVEHFSYLRGIQILKTSHKPFLETFKNNASDFYENISILKSIYLQSNLIFYKYYLNQRSPKPGSDFGDLNHLYSLPYCKMAVMERDMCETLKQIKRRGKVLQTTYIRNINFLKDWELKDD